MFIKEIEQTFINSIPHRGTSLTSKNNSLVLDRVN